MKCTACLFCRVSTSSDRHKNGHGSDSASSSYITKLEQSTFLSTSMNKSQRGKDGLDQWSSHVGYSSSHVGYTSYHLNTC
jgi:hypothetical protein